MLVLDRVRVFRGSSVDVGAFHTGHLGLLPGTVVYPTLRTHRERRDRVELVVTPFRQDFGRVARLTCVMRDEAGAVAALADAIAALGINIVIQESGSINAFQDHVVSMILDWSSTPDYDAEYGVTPETLRRYAHFRKHFPVDQRRYVKLFESIVARCPLTLKWGNVAGTLIPDLAIHPIHETPARLFDKLTIEASQTKNRVRIPLPVEVMEALEEECGELPASYLVLSDPYQRALRVLFITAAFTSRLVHVGFRMKHRPGPLAALMKILSRAGFNIIVSTHRHLKLQTDESVWDVLLECPDGSFNEIEHKQNVDFVTKRLQSHIARDASVAHQVAVLEECAVAVGLPQFPKPTSELTPIPLVPPNGMKSQKRPRVRSTENERDSRVLNVIEKQIRILSNGSEAQRSIATVLRLVSTNIEGDRKQAVFLSYPSNATVIGSSVKRMLERVGYRVEEYQERDGEEILSEVTQRVTRCDFFIGIWHHEKGKYRGVSPWMPYEYGVAMALGKPCYIVCSKFLPKVVRNRISPGTATHLYERATFSKVTLPMMEAYCRKHFVRIDRP